jgi:hypothetical protein
MNSLCGKMALFGLKALGPVRPTVQPLRIGPRRCRKKIFFRSRFKLLKRYQIMLIGITREQI